MSVITLMGLSASDEAESKLGYLAKCQTWGRNDHGSAPLPRAGYRSCLGILRLSQHYEQERLEAAAERALKYNTCSFKSVRAILAAGLDRQPGAEELPPQATLPTHRNIRGQQYYYTTNQGKRMLNEQTIATLNTLKLFGMARAFEERLNNTNHAELSHAEFVGLLVQDEKIYRDNQRLKRLLKNAKLCQQAALEDVDYRHPRGLNKQVMLELSSSPWIDTHRNVLITGPTGIGKSYLACALGNFAARSGYTVLYVRAPRLFETLQQARGDGSHLKTLTRLAKAQLLIIDDFLLTSPADWERWDLLEIVEDRYQSGATVVASQCPIGDWHPNIGDPTLADAICDRLFHNAYKIELRGDSMRRDEASVVEDQKNEKGGNLADDISLS